MRIITLVATCLWFLLLCRSTGANEVDVNCLSSIKSQVEDPKGYLSHWPDDVTSYDSPCSLTGVQCWDENRVMKIELSGYGLKGKFPLLNGCPTLTSLNLSRNNFFGVLPSNISSLAPLLTVLDLSYNQFSGKIPTNLSHLSYLNILRLQHNRFTGQLPPRLILLGRLKEFTVANNHLSGPIPQFNEALTIGLEMFANNTDLCGPPMDLCIDLEEEMIQFRIGAAIGAAVFAPVGALLGWFFFFNGRTGKQGNIRHQS